MLIWAQWSPQGDPGPASGDGEKPPHHPCCCLDTGPYSSGFSPAPPNPSRQAELPSPRDGAGPGLDFKPKHPLLRLPSTSTPLRQDQTPLRGGQEDWAEASIPTSPLPQTQPVSPSSPHGGGGASPQAFLLPQRDAHPATRSLAPQGRCGGHPSVASGSQSFRGSAGALVRGCAPGRGARGECPQGDDGGAGGGCGAQARWGHWAPRGHSPGRLRRGHGAGCGAGAARRRLEQPPPPPTGLAVRAPTGACPLPLSMVRGAGARGAASGGAHSLLAEVRALGPQVSGTVGLAGTRARSCQGGGQAQGTRPGSQWGSVSCLPALARV